MKTTHHLTVRLGIITALAGFISFNTSALDADPALRPAWASDYGVDQFGTWADLKVTGHGLTAVQRFRLIPSGQFIMGQPVREDWGWKPETPHEVTITKDFWLADSECSQRLWVAVTGYTLEGEKSPVTGYQHQAWKSPKADDLELPVVMVNTTDIRGYVGDKPSDCEQSAAFFWRLQKFIFPGRNADEDNKAAWDSHSGWAPVDLPSEAQWEYACRANEGKMGPYSGEPGTIVIDTNGCAPALNPVAWYGHNSKDQTGEEGTLPTGEFGTPHHVKRKLPNAWGLYDMLGNVYEWVGDWPQEDLGTNAVTDPLGMTGRKGMGFRGGGFGCGLKGSGSNTGDVRPTFRAMIHQGDRARDIGFRIRISASTSNTVPKQPPAPIVSSTRTSTPTLSGKATPGWEVRIWNGHTLVAAVEPDRNGVWKWKSPKPLVSGSHSFSVRIRNQFGMSPPSPQLAFNVANQ